MSEEVAVGSRSGFWARARLLRRLRWAHLVPRAAALSLYYRVAARRRSPAALAGRTPLGGGARRPAPELVVAVVRRTLSVPPLRTTCLVRSLVSARLLRRYGYPASVVIGAPTGQPRDWAAHAWVELGGRESPEGAGFVPLVRFSP